MSWDVCLRNPDTGALLEVSPHEEGGTYQVGGCPQADLNITYNYSQHYYRHLYKDEGLKGLHGLTAVSTVERLEAAIEVLGTERSTDYWESTPGNAGYAMSILLGWARQYPHGVWEVS